jgi:hypothetical protein
MTDCRPLYLIAEQPIVVDFACPALRVAAAARAPTLHPLPSLSRVLCRGRVDWAAPALTACLEAGVPIVFVAGDGRVLGVLQVSGADVTGLGEYLRCVAESPDWPERYANWRRAQQRRLIARLCSAVGWPDPQLRPEAMRRQLDRALQRRWAAIPQRLLAPYVPLVRAEVAAALAGAGIDPAISAGFWAGINLSEDLAQLAIWPLRGRLLAGRRPPPAAPAAAIAHYERYLRQPMARTISRLVRYLWRIPL